jgi:hypothetical protein
MLPITDTTNPIAVVHVMRLFIIAGLIAEAVAAKK